MRHATLALSLAALAGAIIVAIGASTVGAPWMAPPPGMPLAAGDIAAPPTATIPQPDIVCRHCTEAPTEPPTATAALATATAASTRPATAAPTNTTAPSRTAAPTATRSTRTPRPTTMAPTATAGPEEDVPPTATSSPTATATPSLTPTLAAPPLLAPSADPTEEAAPTAAPPSAPIPGVTARLWTLSEFAPDLAVFRSESRQIIWPGGEVLHFAPAVALSLPPSPDPAYAYRSRVVAWSFVSSRGVSALGADSMGQVGCRLRTEVSPADAAGLAGCTYRYIEQPSADDMFMQAHAFWSVGRPLAMCVDIYVYDLGQLRSTDLVLQVKVQTEVVETLSTTVVSSRSDIVTLPYQVALIVPRSVQ